MKNEAINWDELPEYITKDQLYRIAHISKSTARYLLKSGKIPCIDTGKKTRCYKIRKADVIEYLENRKVFPESYSAPKGWYAGNYPVKMTPKVPPEVLEQLKAYYTELLKDYRDVLTASQVSKLTGYCKTSVNAWCRNGVLRSFKIGTVSHVPKMYLIDFLCSERFRTITRKSRWHMKTLREFAGRLQKRKSHLK